MRVFVAGATGAIGRRLIPLLVEVGHRVTGSSRTESGVTRLRGQGADGVQVNVFDRDALRAAVAAAAPEVVVHQLTALSQGSAADNARIRRDGTRNLVDAARQAGVTRMVAQSIAWAYAPGRGPAVESTALDVAADPPRSVTVGGVVALEQAVAELDQHVILRFGLLYGPGTWYRRDGRMAHQLAGGAFVATGGSAPSSTSTTRPGRPSWLLAGPAGQSTSSTTSRPAPMPGRRRSPTRSAPRSRRGWTGPRAGSAAPTTPWPARAVAGSRSTLPGARGSPP
jgi:NAD dependent epimerase/dehydratase family